MSDYLVVVTGSYRETIYTQDYLDHVGGDDLTVLRRNDVIWVLKRSGRQTIRIGRLTVGRVIPTGGDAGKYVDVSAL